MSKFSRKFISAVNVYIKMRKTTFTRFKFIAKKPTRYVNLAKYSYRPSSAPFITNCLFYVKKRKKNIKNV